MGQQNEDSNVVAPESSKRTALQRSLSTPRDDVAPARTDASIHSKSFDQVRRSGSWSHHRNSASKLTADADVVPTTESSTTGGDGTTAAAAANPDQHHYSTSDTPPDSNMPAVDTFVETRSSTALPDASSHHSSRSLNHAADHEPVAAAGSDVDQQQTVPDLLLAGEAVVPNPAPAAADAVILEAVQHAPPSADPNPQQTAAADPTPQQTAAADKVRHVAAEGANAAASSLSPAADATISSSRAAGSKRFKQKASTETDSDLDNPASAKRKGSSSSSRRTALPLPALVALGIAAAAAAAGALVYLLKRRGQGSKPAVVAADDDEFTRALKEMDEEERAFEKQAAADKDPAAAELSAEEAALAMQQADAARKEKMIAAALDEGDAELAKIDALDSAELLENLDADELAALEAEFAELEGGDVQESLGETAS